MKNNAMNPMKKYGKIISSLFLIFFFVPQFAHADITSNLLAHWTFDEGTGSTVYDSSGSGISGTLVGTPTWVTGKVGPFALQFNSGSQYVDTSNFADNLPNFSASAWFKTTDSSGSSGIIVGKLSSGGTTSGTGWYISKYGNLLGAVIQNTSGSDYICEYANIGISDGAWHNVVMAVTDGSSSTGASIAIYIDGSASTDTGCSGGTWNTGGYSNTSDVTVGSDSAGEYFPGSIDDVRIYNRTLSSGDASGIDSYAGSTEDQIFITSTSTSSWTVPEDWNSASNTIEVIGGGGGGAEGSPSSQAGAGGAGGDYAKTANLLLTAGGSVNIGVGTGGGGGGNGGDTWFNGTAVIGSSVGAKGGIGGPTSSIGAATGTVANDVGSIAYAGGGGGNGNDDNGGGGGGGGGGGAAGPLGPGGAGAADGSSGTGGGGGGNGGGSNGGTSATGNGGAGGNNASATGGGAGATGIAEGANGTAGGGGGAGGSSEFNGGNGGNGTEWTPIAGSGGGGGGGGAYNQGGTPGNGGLYGGGGAGSDGASYLAGTGGQGIIVITYALPVATSTPSINTLAASSVSSTTMTLNADIISIGSSSVTQSGFAYGTSSTLTGSGVSTTTLGSQGTGDFSDNITGLTSNTLYYFRPYATNSYGTSFGGILSATTTAVADYTSNLVDWYKFDDGTSTTAVDSGSNGYNLTLTASSGSDPAWVDGQIGPSALLFGEGGNFNNADVSDNPFTAGNMTACAWINPVDWGVSGFGRIIDTDSNSNFELFLVQSDGGLSDTVAMSNNGSAGSLLAAPNNSIVMGVWQQVCAVRNSDGSAEIYINGIATSTQGSLAGPTAGTSNLYIGNRSDGARQFDGAIDDVRIYGRSLDSTDIAGLYAYTNNATLNTGLMGWWKFDDGSGTSAVDSSGYGSTASLLGSPAPSWIAGKVGPYALSFNGSSAYADMGSSSANLTNNVKTFSVSMWVKMPVAPAGTDCGELIASNDIGGYTANWEMFGENGACSPAAAGSFGFYIQDSGGSGDADYAYTNATYDDGNWHHVVLVFANGTMTVYIDGSSSGVTFTSNGDATGAMTNASDVMVGTDLHGDFFDGSVDDLRIYDRALSSTEVTELYDLANPPSVATLAATNVGTSTVTLNADLTSIGGASVTQSGFAYGTSSTLTGSGVSTTTLGSQGTGDFSDNITGLTSNTLYYFRPYATNSIGTAFGSISSTTTSAAGNITSNLLSWWKFDEGTGVTANDSSGNGRSGTLTGSPLPTWISGKIGSGALTFNGSSNYVTSSNFADNLNNFTVSTWFRTSAASQPGPTDCGVPIVDKTDGGGIFGNGWYLQIEYASGCPDGNNVENTIGFFVQNNAGNNALGTQSSSTYNDGNWHQAVAVVTGANTATGTVALYMDGSLVSTNNASYAWSGGSFSNTGSVMVGADSDSEYFNGSADDVRIYNRALSSADVATLYQYTSPVVAQATSFVVSLRNFIINAGSNFIIR